MIYHVQFLIMLHFVALLAMMALAYTGDEGAMQICMDFGNWLTQKGCEYGAFEGINYFKQCGVKL